MSSPNMASLTRGSSSANLMATERKSNDYCYFDSTGAILTEHVVDDDNNNGDPRIKTNQESNKKSGSSSGGGMKRTLSSPNMAPRDNDEDYCCVIKNNPFAEIAEEEDTRVTDAPKNKSSSGGMGMKRSISSHHMAKRSDVLYEGHGYHDDQDDYNNRIESDYEYSFDTSASSYYPKRDNETTTTTTITTLPSTYNKQRHDSMTSLATVATAECGSSLVSSSDCEHSLSSHKDSSCHSLMFVPKSILKKPTSTTTTSSNDEGDDKAVRFTEVDEVMTILSIDDMTEDEIMNAWITKFEKKSIQRSCERIVKLVEEFGADSDIIQGRKLCTRGLENYGGMSVYQSERYELTREEVFFEQDEQNEFNYHDPEAIAKAYHSSGMIHQSKCIAEFRAIQDHEEVKKYMKFTEWIECMNYYQYQYS